jgi:3-oxoacyl-[acyl-carrier protein] reductase
MIYAAAEGFVSTITKGHAEELIGKKIRVNAVSPGVIATPFRERYTDAAPLEAIRKTIPSPASGPPRSALAPTCSSPPRR